MLRRKTLRKAIAVCLGITLIPSLLFAGVNIPGYYGNVTLPSTVTTRPSLPSTGVQIPGFYGNTTLPTVAPTQLPVLKAGGVLSGVTAPTTAAADDPATGTTIQKMTISQYQEQAVIDWQSFDIGQNAWVYFEQKKDGVAQPGWSALNRIWDLSPSQILGRLTADGKIYLINRNGILFGPGSSVNVHTLIASSVNLAESDFMKGLLKFNTNDEYVNGELFYDSTKTPGVVSNHGTIETDEMGSVFLVAPTVENSGIISSPVGQIGLVAATAAEIVQDPSSTTRTAPIVHITGTPGEATNFENGWLIANTGLAGMYGRLVNQDGLIMAVTAVKKAGAIELHASEKVSTGSNSFTLTPISNSTETAHQSFEFNGGTVDIGGLMQPYYDSGNNLVGFNNTSTSRIEHRGAIDAPSGSVSLRASERVYLENGSRVDVSGLWVDKPASANVLEAQLNSVELRDDDGQKDGLLKGQKIWFDALYGSAIGDVSGSYSAQELSAREHAVKGGQITIDAGEGDVIVREGATIRFAGGGYRYAAGMIETTALMAGTTIYSISDAPQWIDYDTLTTQTSYVGERVEGSDAGKLSIAAKRIVLDGRLDGSVVKGQYQTQAEENTNKSGNQNSKGLSEPRGGMLLLGTAPVEGRLPENESFRLDEVIIKSFVNPLPGDFGPEDPIPPEYAMGEGGSDVTILSAQTLSNAGLGRLEVYANTLLRVDEGANIVIPSAAYFDETGEPDFAAKVGGYFSAAARRIELFGGIYVPAGEIILKLKSNISALEAINGASNPLYRAIQQRIFLGAGSRLIAAGEQIDNSLTAGGGSIQTGQISGGRISILDDINAEVIIDKGALLDVSGGFSINQNGKVTGGDAGSIEINGTAMVLEGELKGLSLAGKRGGSLTIAAWSPIEIAGNSPLSLNLAPDATLPEEQKNGLVLGQSQFNEAGFADITIESVYSLTIDEGVRLMPSTAKMAQPIPGQGSSSIIHVQSDTISASSIKLTAGKGLSQEYVTEGVKVVIKKDAEIDVFPGGTIEIQGPGISLDGTLSAPAGTVSLKATYFDLTMQNGSRILAQGYNKPETTPVMTGYPTGYTAMAGGKVALTAALGRLVLEDGSLIDVSGSDPVQTYVKTTQGLPQAMTVAGDAGSLVLTYYDTDSIFNGALKASAKMAGLHGGTLTIKSTSNTEAFVVTPDSVGHYLTGGFDDITLQSLYALEFSGSLDAQVARRLVLDAPVIKGSNNGIVSLSSPWTSVINTYYPASQTPASGGAQITLSGDWIDVEGSVCFSGFSNVTLNAANDIRLSDRFYDVTPKLWKGVLQTSGELLFQADRVYPTTLAEFTVSAEKVTILPGDVADAGTIYSAGGKLSIYAKEIENRGILAAPLGEIVLAGAYDTQTMSYTQADRVVLSGGSIITVEGSGLVGYGTVDETSWRIPDRTSDSADATVPVTGEPAKSVTIKAKDISIGEGSEINVSGGGTIFSYLFLSSPAGSTDPLTETGRYVIVPGVTIPGEAVYLEGGGIAAGYYSLLPEEYAFLPGAMIITDLSKAGQKYTLGQTISQEGYPVAKGYSTVMGTGFRSVKPVGYSVRRASDVLKEGYFTGPERAIEAGNAGTITIAGNSVAIDGTLTMKALPGYKGGTLSLSSGTIVVGTSAPEEGTLSIDPIIFTAMDLEEINIGDASVTNKITLEDGSVLRADRITLAANAGDAEIILNPGAEIYAYATDGTGIVNILTPDGKVTLDAVAGKSSLIRASDMVYMDINDIDLRGDIIVDHGTLGIKVPKIYFVPEGYGRLPGEKGLFLTQGQWNSFSDLQGIELIGKGASEVLFKTDFGLNTAGDLTIDAARIAAAPLVTGGQNAWTITVNAHTINLLNTRTASSATTTADTGTITFNASEFSIGHGDMKIDGFSQINLISQGDIVFQGAGSFTSGGADVTILAPRVTTSYYQDALTAYETAGFTLDAGDKVFNIGSNGGTPGQGSVPGGFLEIKGRRIDLTGVVEVNSGQVKLNASGLAADGDGIFLGNGAQILAQGSEYSPGGTIDLKTEQGIIDIASGATIDVSAGAQGDAGLISLYAPAGGVTLNGNMQGHAGPLGRGGSLTMVTYSINDFEDLNDKMITGGFDESLNIRTRSGDIAIDDGVTVMARNVRITTDGGSIDLSGAIDVSGSGSGGTAELNAKQDLTISGNISAQGTTEDADGGDVYLSVDQGYLYFLGGGIIDVSGSGAGSGGVVIFRDPPPPAGYPARMSLAGTVRGATSIIAQIDQIYEGYSTITSTVINQIRTDITNFMNTYGDSLKTTLLSHLILDGVSQDAFHLQPGVVIQQPGDITLSSDWDMTSWRFLGEPGTLTLRAGGNLNIYANLVDHPTALSSLPGTSGRDSWGINLVAGADTSSGDLMVVKQGTGNLTIGPDNTNPRYVGGKMVYSESAPVRFASGGDTLVRSGPSTGYMINSSIRYTLGSYDGDITGYVAGNLTIKGGAIQTAISDINITVAGNLVMDYGNDYNTTNTSIGSIRTTGQHQTPSSVNMLFYWEYEDGGDIVLEIGKSLIGRVNQNSDTKKNAWDNPYKYYDRDTGIWSTNFDVWAASYPGAPRTSGYETTEGLVTMAGGDIRVHAGGDFFIQTGTFGEGDLKIYAGGNIDGRFLVKEGAGEIHSLANFGVKQIANQSIELFDAQVNLSAQGDIRIGTFLNPMIANLSFTDWNLQYGTESSVKLRAVTGDVSLSGDSAFYSLTTSYQNRERILPPVVEIRAGGDILLSNEFALVPSPTGNLVLEAGRDINGAYGDEKRSSFVVSDMLPDDVYGLHKGFVVSSLFNPNEHALSVHTEDPVPIQITAIEGDIKNLQLALPKFARIEAGQDIIDIYYLGQNVNPEDITLIRAGRNLLFSEAFGTDYDTGIVHGGPGTLIVQAGNNIDLGTTLGIQTVGNGYNSALDKTKGSDLIVAAGIGIDLDPYTMKEFFDELREAGKEYTDLRIKGDIAGAEAVAGKTRREIILPVIGEEEEDTEGVLDMVRSQISTKAGTDNIYLLVRGDLNLGKSSFVSDADRKNTGVFTAAGGAINVLGGGDVNVNEARVMTFRGGDITVYALWNNDSVVNAGRGSKTAINVEPPMTVKEYEYVQEGGKTVKRLKSQTIVFEPPSVGSGIRTLTYDPDGEAGPLKAPAEGDIYIFASTIDAGEAGIRGRNVTLGAQTVVNVQNISFSMGAVGITTQSQGGVSLGALTGSTSLNTAASVSQDMTAMAAGRTSERAMQQPIEDIMKWVDVKVIGYDLNAPTIGGPDEQEGGQES